MAKCILDGFVYPFNPPEYSNPPVRAIVPTETLAGRNFTDWGSQASRRDITQTWTAMRTAFYDALCAKAAVPGSVLFTDQRGHVWRVMVNPPVAQREAKSGIGYISVTLKMHVVAQIS